MSNGEKRNLDLDVFWFLQENGLLSPRCVAKEHPLTSADTCDECYTWFDEGKECCKKCEMDFSVFNEDEEEETGRVMTCAKCNLDYLESEECRHCGYYKGQQE